MDNSLAKGGPGMSAKTKRFLLILLASAALVTGLAWGNSAIQVTRYFVQSSKLPPAFSGFTIAQVSDLHNQRFGRGQNHLLSKLSDAAPDLIAVTGDLLDSRHPDLPAAMEFIHGAVAIAPVYFVSGNHEAWGGQYELLQDKLVAAGVTILDDRTVCIERDGESILLAGVADPAFGDEDLAVLPDEEIYTILLAHRPEHFPLYAEAGFDLILSGHAHGGQVRLPWLGGVVAPDQGFFPAYSEGLYGIEKSRMLVSRGLGNSIIPLRINNRPELPVLLLED